MHEPKFVPRHACSPLCLPACRDEHDRRNIHCKTVCALASGKEVGSLRSCLQYARPKSASMCVGVCIHLRVCVFPGSFSGHRALHGAV
eukprot:11839565-Alexandrium_andersonii.AAC.1